MLGVRFWDVLSILPPEVYDELNKFDEEQLRELNRRVVARLNLFQKARNLKSLAKFNIGDRIYFIHEGRKMTGTVIRLNQKSASVHLDEGGHWTVAPGFLSLL